MRDGKFFSALADHARHALSLQRHYVLLVAIALHSHNRRMIPFLFQLLVGIVGGVAAGLQAPFTGVMGGKVGELGSVAITYCGGALLVAIIALASGGGGLSEWRSIPWYAYAAGPLGLVIIGSLAYTVPRLGATASTTIFVVGWLLFSTAVDQFGLFGTDVKTLDLQRTLGIAALLGGTYLVIR